MVFSLRDYQIQVISDCYRLIRKGEKRILLFAPTGAGKTLIASRLTSDATSRGRKVLFVVHREVLIGQTYEKFSSFGLDCGFIKAGWPENLQAPVQIASVQTLSKRRNWEELHFDVILFDECHLVSFAKVCQRMMKTTYSQAICIGLTATPWRLSKQESLGDIYSALVCAPMPKKLIERGFLVKPSYYGLDFLSEVLEEVAITNGDYDSNQLNIVCDQPELLEQICTAWKELAVGRPTIAFAVGVAHAHHIAEKFVHHNIPAAVVSGKTPIPVRKELYQQLARNELQVLASCAALSEGFDVPEVSCVILARPTQSKALYFQQLGRGLRLAENKRDCLVLDQSGNVEKHGFIEDLETVELTPSNDREQKKGEAPVKICPVSEGGCGAYIYSFYRYCPHCCYNFEVSQLIKVLGNERLISPDDEIKLSFYRGKLRESFEREYAPSWAAMKFKDKYGFFPPYDWARGAVFDHQLSQMHEYQKHLQKIAQRKDKDVTWVEKYLCLEFGG